MKVLYKCPQRVDLSPGLRGRKRTLASRPESGRGRRQLGAVSGPWLRVYGRRRAPSAWTTATDGLGPVATAR